MAVYPPCVLRLCVLSDAKLRRVGRVVVTFLPNRGREEGAGGGWRKKNWSWREQFPRSFRQKRGLMASSTPCSLNIYAIFFLRMCYSCHSNIFSLLNDLCHPFEAALKTTSTPSPEKGSCARWRFLPFVVLGFFQKNLLFAWAGGQLIYE